MTGRTLASMNDMVTQQVQEEDDRKLLRKLDLRLIPTMTLLYLLSFLDRVNIGHAKLNGLTSSLHLSSFQYNICLSVFFITYVAFEIPSNLFLKKFRPSRWIPSIMIAWGTVMTCMGLVRSYEGLLICRLLLGVTESGLFPGATFYLSSWYKRRELSWRVSILFSAAALAGGFGGVVAYGINKMHGLGGQEGWRWIFYIEGIITVFVGIGAFFVLYDFPSDRPRFLTEQECDRVLSRLRTDVGLDINEQFSWNQVRAAFSDWKIYIFALAFISMSVPLFSLSLVSPTIIQNLGFATFQAQLLTTPPYGLAFITTMVTAYFSDRYAQRSIFILFWLMISISGFILLIAVDNVKVKYFALFLSTAGISPCIATCITFLSCNISPQTKRATALAFMISIGSLGGIISGQIYRTQDAPQFIFGHAINLGFCTLSLLATVIIFISLHMENRRRDRLFELKGEKTCFEYEHVHKHQLSERQIRDLGDKHVTWRYIL